MKTHLYLPEGPVRVWLRLMPGEEDLEFHECRAPALGARPEWLTEEVQNAGWEGILQPAWRTVESGLGWCFTESHTYWALTRGIAPRQPFLVQLPPPVWEPGPYEYPDDGDMRYEPEIVQRAPWSPSQIRKAWDSWYRELTAYRRSACQAMRELLERQVQDRNAWYLSWSYYRSSQQASWEFPGGAQVKLLTPHRTVTGCFKSSYGELGWGRSERGDHAEALRELHASLLPQFPELTLEALEALPVRH